MRTEFPVRIVYAEVNICHNFEGWEDSSIKWTAHFAYNNMHTVVWLYMVPQSPYWQPRPYQTSITTERKKLNILSQVYSTSVFDTNGKRISTSKLQSS